jgi:hypothetical protein
LRIGESQVIDNGLPENIDDLAVDEIEYVDECQGAEYEIPITRV